MTFSAYHPRLLLAALALLLPVGLFAQAAAPAANGVETQLREALRSSTLQLRTAQGELANAQSDREQAKSDLAALQKRLDTLEKQSAADRSAAQTSLSNLTAQLAAKDAENARLAEKLTTALATLDQTRRLADERAQSITVAKTRSAEFENANSQLRAQNRELFRIGNEVLERYENYGLGRSLASREPFTKLTRVRLQNLVQDYSDALEKQRAKLPPEPAAPAPAKS